MSTYDISINNQFCESTPGHRNRFRVSRILEVLAEWHERARQRRELEELSDHTLRDIGLTPEDVYREIRKPFWRA